MNRFLWLFLTTIILVVVTSFYIDVTEKNNGGRSENSNQPGDVYGSDTHLFRTVNETAEEKIQKLENEVTNLKLRIAELEKMINISESDQHSVHETAISTETVNTTAPVFKSMSVDTLTSVGVSDDVAADIMRRSNEQEYRKLELRDRAIRDGYLNKPEYYRQLRELNDQSLSLRDELGDKVYDRYLYATGQNNRIQVSSVMQGSPAEMAGVQSDDIVLTYGGQSILHYSDIRQATSQGELTDYVTVVVLRDGELINVMLPRGPMGIRLQATRDEPLGN